MPLPGLDGVVQDLENSLSKMEPLFREGKDVLAGQMLVDALSKTGYSAELIFHGFSRIAQKLDMLHFKQAVNKLPQSFPAVELAVNMGLFLVFPEETAKEADAIVPVSAIVPEERNPSKRARSESNDHLDRDLGKNSVLDEDSTKKPKAKKADSKKMARYKDGSREIQAKDEEEEESGQVENEEHEERVDRVIQMEGYDESQVEQLEEDDVNSKVDSTVLTNQECGSSLEEKEEPVKALTKREIAAAFVTEQQPLLLRRAAECSADGPFQRLMDIELEEDPIDCIATAIGMTMATGFRGALLVGLMVAIALKVNKNSTVTDVHRLLKRKKQLTFGPDWLRDRHNAFVLVTKLPLMLFFEGKLKEIRDIRELIPKIVQERSVEQEWQIGSRREDQDEMEWIIGSSSSSSQNENRRAEIKI